MNMQVKYRRISSDCKTNVLRIRAMLVCMLLFIFSLIMPSIQTKAQYSYDDENKLPLFSYDELQVNVYLGGDLSFDTYIIITNADVLYVNVEDLFKHLGIYCLVEEYGNILSGFIENENKPYVIDYNEKLISVGKNMVNTQQGLFKEMGGIYLEASLLKDLFGLDVTFDPRSLYVSLSPNFELPFVRQKRLEQMRENVSRIKGEDITADTVVNRDYHLFKFGMMDWSLASYQTINARTRNYLSIGLGAELLFGEANITLSYSDQYALDYRNIQYKWRWVDNDKTLIRQAQLGKIHSQTIAFLNSPVIGASFTNAPTTIRKATGSYIIDEYTEPDWTVELYLNDVLVDFTTADASGFFSFKVPIVYGFTTITLRFYGPMGEERREERTMNVPFTFLPAKTLEYGFSAGVLENDLSASALEDGVESRFGKGAVKYGVNRFLTLGAGVEYLSSISNNPYIPYTTASLIPFSRLILNFEYAYGVRMIGNLNYNFFKNAFLEIDYAKYKEGQLATPFNANEELRARLSFPLKIKKVAGLMKMNFNQSVYDLFTYYQADFTLTAYYKQFNANLSSQYNWVSNNRAFNTSTLSLSYRMRRGLVLRPSIDYALIDNNLMRVRMEIEKRISKAYVSVYYERDVMTQSDNIFVSFRYDLPFARTSASASYANSRVRFTESAAGGFAFGGDNNYVKAGNNSTVGKGGILLYPFLDLNHNGVKDKGEHMVMLSTVKISGGRAIISEKDSIVRISDLNPFVDYDIEFSDFDLQNIAWRFKHKTYQVLVDPNQYKRVYVPIISVGEISGMVYLDEENTMKGLGRITIQIWDTKGNRVTEILSERNGFYNYLGLNPGEYIVRVDEEQLEKLDFQSTPPFENISIIVSVDGDFVNGLDFVLRPKGTTSSLQNTGQESGNTIEKEQDSTEINKLPIKKLESDSLDVKPALQKTQPGDSIFQQENPKAPETEMKENSGSNINTSFENIAEIEESFYTVQIGVYKNYVTAGQLNNLTPIFYKVLPNGTNKYFSGKYNSQAEAEIAKKHIIETGIKGARVVTHQKGNKG
jgi:hypothetical protein